MGDCGQRMEHMVRITEMIYEKTITTKKKVKILNVAEGEEGCGHGGALKEEVKGRKTMCVHSVTSYESTLTRS